MHIPRSRRYACRDRRACSQIDWQQLTRSMLRGGKEGGRTLLSETAHRYAAPAWEAETCASVKSVPNS